MEGLVLLGLLILGAIVAFPIYVLIRLSDHTTQLLWMRRELEALRRAARPAAPEASAPAPTPAPAERRREVLEALRQPPPAPSPPSIPPPPTPQPAPSVPPPAPAAPAAAPAPPPPPAGPPPSRPAAPAGPARSFDLEAIIGANWLAKLGVIAIAVAAAFFLKYAIDSGWIGPTARVAIGLATAAVLLGAGQWLLAKPKYRTYAQALASGGVVILFLSIYAAYEFYGLIPFGVAFGVLAVAALAASLLALSNNTQAVAVLCLLGAFATPILIRNEGEGASNLLNLYIYLAGLNVWTIVLVRLRPWHSLLALSLGATWLIFFGAGQLDRHNYWAVESFAALFLLFSFAGGRQFGAERAEVPASPLAGTAAVILGFLAFAVASVFALEGVELLGLPALVAVGVLVALGLVAAPFALSALGPTAAAVLRGLGAAALVLLVAITVAVAPPVTRAQAPAAFAFTTGIYLAFLIIALHMQTREEGERPATGLVLANALTHAVAVAHALAPIRLLGLPAYFLWLPVAGWVGLAALPLTRRRDGAITGFSMSLMATAVALPLISLFGLLDRVPPREIMPALGAFGGEFLLLSVTWVAARRAVRGGNLRGDVLGPLLTAAVFFGLFSTLAWNRAFEGFSLLCGCALALAFYHALIGSFVLVRKDDDLLIRLTYLGLALTFVTIAIPLQLKATALTAAWAVEAVVLVWTGLAVREQRLRGYGLLLLAVTAAKALVLDLPEVTAAGFLLNPRFLGGVILSAAAYVSAYLLWHRREALVPKERWLAVSAVLVGSAVAVMFLSAELWFTAGARWPAAGMDSAQQAVLTLLWSIAAALALAAGARYTSRPVRVLGWVLFSVAAFKVVFVDLSFAPSPFHVLTNTRTAAGAAVIAAAYVIAWALRRRGPEAPEAPIYLRAGLFAVASLLTLVFVSADLWDRYVGQSSAQQLSLSIFWSAYALAVFCVGIWKRLRPVRLAAMGLLYVSVFKVFLFDLNFLETPYRIISFLGLGVILLLVSLLYHRFEERLR